jgi:predicted nucleic acid-binding protein
MNALLADTGPLYAVSIASDQYHQRVQREMRRISEEERGIVIPYPIVMETYTLLLRRVTPQAAQVWLRQLAERASLIAPTLNDYDAAARLVRRYQDQTITLFDALLAVLAERLALPVWTFDAHLEVMRVEVWR